MTKRVQNSAVLLLALAALLGGALPTRAQLQPVVPKEKRGQADAERSGTHDAANIRTLFYNYGMVGGYPADPQNVDLSVFHSMEVPRGSGMNYSDGVTPFVLAKVRQTNGTDAFIMETGYRERQGVSPNFNRVMRFEPRPGFFQADPAINRGRSPALSNDPRTWPDEWPDRAADPDDPGWSGSWNGYFGKRPAADQESYTVMDDDYYAAGDWGCASRSGAFSGPIPRRRTSSSGITTLRTSRRPTTTTTSSSACTWTRAWAAPHSPATACTSRMTTTRSMTNRSG
jgi:hypothetical protein